MTVQKFLAACDRAGGLHLIVPARLAEEQQHRNEHEEDAKRGHAEDTLHPHVLVNIGGDERSRSATDIHQRVIDGVADGAHILFRSARRSADHAGFHQRDAQGRQGQHEGRQGNQRHIVANGGQPGRSQRSQQEVGATQDQVGEGKGATEAHPVSHGSAEYRQKPHQPAEDSGERTRLLGWEMQRFMEVARQRGEGRVIGKPLEQLAEVGDPEGALKAGANVVPTLRKAQIVSSWNQSSVASSRLSVASSQLSVVRCSKLRVENTFRCAQEQVEDGPALAAEVVLKRPLPQRLKPLSSTLTFYCTPEGVLHPDLTQPFPQPIFHLSG